VIATSTSVITERDVREAQQRADEAHAAAERAWEAVEEATRQAEAAEAAANHWEQMARRVSLQVGFRRPCPPSDPSVLLGVCRVLP
jgi:hypothetical protein